MGKKASDPIDLQGEALANYLRTNHSIYMDLVGASYYLTDVNDHYWRVQDTAQLNDKGHYVDVSEPVATVSEFMAAPAFDGRSLAEVAEQATFFPSIKEDA
ncbi:MAG: CDP-alcohol phosphatidyltransferase [Coriobacteriales bacterium]